jgi:molybdate transport system regulatory protein
MYNNKFYYELLFWENMTESTVNWCLKSKVWLERDGQPIIGEGRMAMLLAIHHNNSILKASEQTGISYRRMRGAIRDMEKEIGQPLILTRRGGVEGGGAELTPLALELIEMFDKLSGGFQNEVDERLRSLQYSERMADFANR